MRILIIGNGYIGQRCKEIWGDSADLFTGRITSKSDLEQLLDSKCYDAVLNAAGTKGNPNVDWCETHKFETIAGNVILPVLIADVCSSRNVYLLHIGSGCVFYGKSTDPLGWKEEDLANPVAFYSKTKYAADLVLNSMPNVGIARIRIPLDDRKCSGNIITKLAGYSKIIDVSNSITIVPDAIEVFYKLIEKKAQGIYHVTNPGILSYRWLMQIYQMYVDENQRNEWITEEDLVTQGLTSAIRSTNILQSRLNELGINMPHVMDSALKMVQKYGK